MRSIFFHFFVAIGLSHFVVCVGAGELVPPKGVDVPAPVKAELEKSLGALNKEIDALRNELKSKPQLLSLLPDVQIFANAVRFALEDNMFYANAKSGKVTEFDAAKKLLSLGMERSKELRAGNTPWTSQTGPVVRGYASKLDGTAIPYGLIVPAAFKSSDAKKLRLDFWFMGRDNNNSELKFISGKLNGKAQFMPEDAFVLQPFGRYCNAYKFAGEMDALEALDHVSAHYPVDPARISVRGFSMGGAATWHLGAHHAGQWAAINPGAGFTDVATYQKIAPDDPKYPWYERKLWHLYDPVDYAINLTNSTLVAYSGEIDPQKAAADLMEKTLKGLGVKMTHIVGPQTGHKYEPKAQAEVAKFVDAAVERGVDFNAKHVVFTTWTLKWNTMKWITVDGLEKHWQRANVDATQGPDAITVTTSNVNALTITASGAKAIIDGATLPMSSGKSGSSFEKKNGAWVVATSDEKELRKRHNLQGPIDDAFMDSFLFVRPTGTALNDKLKKWTDNEMAFAAQRWHLELRGEVRAKNDKDISDDDIANHNLILWGDPSSNAVLARVIAKLPLKWTAQELEIGGKKYPADSCAPVLIYPNPLNPKKYIVINSGFTFVQFASVSNAQQTPKLPDWAVIDMEVSAKDRLAKGIKDAGFFGEKWEYLEERK